MKKTSKKVNKPEVKAEPKETPKLPAFTPGAVNVLFTHDELTNYAQLLSVMAQGLEQMAQDSMKANDLKSADILAARAQLSAILAGKLNAHFVIGESPSRDMH